MGYNPADFISPNRPVEQVNWNDIQQFIKKLNQKTGKQYRLPTEVEWSRACYADSKTDTEYCGSDDIDVVAWYYGNSDRQTHPVGQKKANAFGLHDMSGNAWEWTNDCWDDDCPRRVLRGGSWTDVWVNVRAEDRDWDSERIRANDNGFRLARPLP